MRRESEEKLTRQGEEMLSTFLAYVDGYRMGLQDCQGDLDRVMEAEGVGLTGLQVAAALSARIAQSDTEAKRTQEGFLARRQLMTSRDDDQEYRDAYRAMEIQSGDT